MAGLRFTRVRPTAGRTSPARRRLPAAPAFTLVELLIVVALLAMVLTLSLPSLRKLSAKSELRNAARQLRVTLLESRLAAIESGSLTYFRYQPGGGRFEAGRGIKRPARFRRSRAGRRSPQNLTSPTPCHGARTRRHSRSRCPSACGSPSHRQTGNSATPAAASELPDDASWSAPIVFYPNGRTRNARIALVNEAYRIELNVRGLTGTVQISQVERLVPVEAEPSESDRGGRAMSRSALGPDSRCSK